MSEAFFKLSWVRKDGGAHETTVIGYGAESMVFQTCQELEANKHILFVAVIRRETNRFGGDLSWHVVRQFIRAKEEEG